MTFKEQIRQAADAGHRLKPEYDKWCEEQRLLAEQRRVAEEKARTERVKKQLKWLPETVREAARKGERYCIAAMVHVEDIEGWQKMLVGQPIDSRSLRGDALRIFELLEADGLSPRLIIGLYRLFYITIPIPLPSEGQP